MRRQRHGERAPCSTCRRDGSDRAASTSVSNVLVPLDGRRRRFAHVGRARCRQRADAAVRGRSVQATQPADTVRVLESFSGTYARYSIPNVSRSTARNWHSSSDATPSIDEARDVGSGARLSQQNRWVSAANGTSTVSSPGAARLEPPAVLERLRDLDAGSDPTPPCPADAAVHRCVEHFERDQMVRCRAHDVRFDVLRDVEIAVQRVDDRVVAHGARPVRVRRTGSCRGSSRTTVAGPSISETMSTPVIVMMALCHTVAAPLNLALAVIARVPVGLPVSRPPS